MKMLDKQISMIYNFNEYRGKSNFRKGDSKNE